MTNATKYAKKFGEMIGWDGQIITEPDKSDYEKLGAAFLNAYPEVLEQIAPTWFDNVDEYIEHVKSTGRSVEYHLTSKLIACYWSSEELENY